jgi:hypothetical protein
MAPPVRRKSVKFIAASIETIDINDIPKAVLNANCNAICRARIIVSRIIDVSKPLNIASDIIKNTGHSIPVTWKYNIVPISPIEHPNRHQLVL